MSAQGPSRRAIDATYHPQSGGASPSLQRARKPFRVGNAVIGSAIALFAAGVYTYSISSVKQDDFSDVEDLLPPLADRSQIRSIEDDARSAAAAAGAKTNAFQSIVSTLPSRPSGDPASAARTGTADLPGTVSSSLASQAKGVPSVVGVADAELGIGSSASGTSTSTSTGSRVRDELHQARETVRDEIREVKQGFFSGVTSVLPRRLDDVRWVRERGLVELGKGNVIVWGAPNVDRVGNVGDDASKRSKGGRLV